MGSLRPFASSHVRRQLIVGTALLLGLLAASAPSLASATAAWVDTGGDCLRLRTAPGLSSGDISCLDHGAELVLLGPSEDRDGFTWVQVQAGSLTGWVADYYVTTDPTDVQVINETPAAATGALATPPVGGITLGRAGTSDLAALVAAQPYDVLSVWHFDVTTQRMTQYVPGAPAFVNSLSSIGPDDIVMIRRGGVLTSVGAVPDPSLTVAGTPTVLPTPPLGGMTIGLSGTTDPKFLVQGQDFTVESVWYFHIESQRWLSYVPGAPDYIQSLKQGHLRTDSIVFVKRGLDAPKPPSSEDSSRFETSITYYFCVPTGDARTHGDGGGYCGSMANGEVVHEGAAACKPGLLGQRFRIEGDPTGRIYECTDTGGSVLNDHRDIWFMNSADGYEWWVTVGDRAFIEVVE